MVLFRRGSGNGEVEAVKLFLTGDETTSDGARVRWCMLWQESDGAKKSMPRGIRTYL